VPERITVDAEQVRRLVEEQFSRWAGLPVQPVADGGWDGTENWFHGDVAEGNLLLSDGQLAAVIDFGTCGVGDMACDLAIAWTLLTADSQTAFRERLSVSDAAWARGRGWALWKSLAACASSLGETDAEAARAQHVLGEIFSEYSGGDGRPRR
jgi:aminoglycoside phosphotransferase (APT) family kinase protein